MTATYRDYEAILSRSSSSNFVYSSAPVATRHEVHDSDEPAGCLPWSIMEKLKNSKVAHWTNKLAVENDENLTTSQLML